MVGSHQLSPEAKEKAAKRRAKQAAENHKVTASKREQAQQLKKQERKQEELVSCRPGMAFLSESIWHDVAYRIAVLKHSRSPAFNGLMCGTAKYACCIACEVYSAAKVLTGN